METNVLIAKTQLGKVKQTVFNTSSPDRAYGAVQPPDAEGARAVISTWKPHVPNPHAKPGPDFLAMNRAAADTGLVSSGQFKAFRYVHPMHLRTGVEGVSKQAPALPSDKDHSFTYGKPAAYRTAEVVRSCGPQEPRMGALMQNAYGKDWVSMNMARKEEFDDRRRYIKPAATGATQGHALGALRTMEAAAAASSGGAKKWKMQRFERHAQSRIVRYMYSGRSSSSSSAGAKAAEEDQQQAVCVEEQRDQQEQD